MKIIKEEQFAALLGRLFSSNKIWYVRYKETKQRKWRTKTQRMLDSNRTSPAVFWTSSFIKKSFEMGSVVDANLLQILFVKRIHHSQGGFTRRQTVQPLQEFLNGFIIVSIP